MLRCLDMCATRTEGSKAYLNRYGLTNNRLIQGNLGSARRRTQTTNIIVI